MPLEHLILPTRQTRSIERLSGVCFWSGVQVTRLVPGEEDALPVGAALTNATVHGGPLFCRRVAAAMGGVVVEPGRDFLPALPPEYVSRRIALTTLGRARLLAGPKFIKPVADKLFPAAVYESGEYLSAPPDLDAEPVLVSDPVEWEHEHRMFVCDGQVKTFSPYSIDGNVVSTEEQGQEALKFTERVLADARVTLPRAVVLDVGWIRGAGWAVVEANEAVMSGLYDCDPIAVLDVLARGLMPEPSAEDRAVAEARARFPVGQRVRTIRRSKSGRIKEGVVLSVEVHIVDKGDGSSEKQSVSIIARFRHGVVMCGNGGGIEPIPSDEPGGAP